MAKQKVALTTLLIALVIGTLIGGVQTASTQIADTTLAHEELHALAQGLIETSGNVDQMLDAEDNRTVAGDQIVAVGQGITGILSFGSSRTGTYDIYSKSILGGPSSPLVQGVGQQVTPSWSPDGTQMVYASDQDGDYDIYLRTANGQQISLTNNTSADIHPSWSPDGQRVIFSSNRSGYYQAYTVPVSGGSATQVGAMSANVLWPRFSPDGSRISYMRASIPLPACDWNWDIWTMDTAGNNQLRISSWLGGDLYPSWLPDGRIVYSSCQNFLTADLFLVDPVTGVSNQLTAWPTGSELGAVYSPDGAYIAFSSNVTGDYEIYLAAAAGGEAVNISTTPGEDLTPSWQPSSEQVGSYTVSGWLLDIYGDPISGAVVSAGGRTAISTADGYFLIADLPAGLHTVIPTKDSLYFSPLFRTVTTPPNQDTMFFVATDTPCPNVLSGIVRDLADESVLEGVSVTVSSTEVTETTVTDVLGYYVFTNLPAGVYQVQVEKPGYEIQTRIMYLNADSVCDVYSPYLSPIVTYLDLAAHYAPVWYQDVDMEDADADFITNFDFDGNWSGADNWQHQNDNHPLKAYIYYAVLETESHWYIHYADFHPRDWGAELKLKCKDEDIPYYNVYQCHENDMEGALVAVKKNGTPYGEFHFLATVYHTVFEKYANDPDIIGENGGVLFYEDTHPRVYVQPNGHGVKAYSSDTPFEGGDGVIYYYQADNATEPPSIVTGQAVTAYYDLIRISGPLWNRRFDYLIPLPDAQKTYQNWGVFDEDEMQPGGTARPPWGWTDVYNFQIEEGDFFFNPAYIGQVYFDGLGADFSQSYIYNPYCFSNITVLPDKGVYLLSIDGRIQIWVPPGSTSEEITLTHSNECDQVTSSPQHLFPEAASNDPITAFKTVLNAESNHVIVGHTFELEARTVAGQTLLTDLTQPYELQFRYTDLDVVGLYEDSLTLYRWDGTNWILETSTQVNMQENLLHAFPSEMGLFVVVGTERHEIYLPLVNN